MKKLFFFIFLISIVACNAQNNAVQKISVDEFEKNITTTKVQVFDVRTIAEYQTGHLKNSMQADWNDKTQFNERIKHIDKNVPVYIYCLSGMRSAQAADYMRKTGYNVVEMNGGISAWKQNGKPIVNAVNERQYTMEEYASMIPSDKKVLVNFGADWCPPCVKMKPVLEELISKKGKELEHVKIDAGIQTNLMKSLNIESIPVYIYYKNGKEVWRKEGIVSIEEFLAEL